MVGEIGGGMEEDAAEYAADHAQAGRVPSSPARASPPGKTDGPCRRDRHRGAGAATIPSARRSRTAGVVVVDTPSQVGEALKAKIGQRINA